MTRLVPQPLWPPGRRQPCSTTRVQKPQRRMRAALFCLSGAVVTILGAVDKVGLQPPHALAAAVLSASSPGLANTMGVDTGSSAGPGAKGGGAGGKRSFGKYLLETGLLWPVVAIVGVILYLQTKRQTQPPPQQEQALTLPPPQPQPSARVSYEPPPVQSAPLTSRTPPQMHEEPQYMTPVMHSYGQELALPPPLPPSPPQLTVTATDLKPLIRRTRNDPEMVEGVAHVQRLIGNEKHGHDICTKMGVMTAKKVIEIERLLVEELQESILANIGFLASCFHCWRAEAMLEGAGRHFQDEYNRSKDEWEKYLTDQRLSWEHKILTAQEKAERLKDKHRKQAELMLEEWLLGDSAGLQVGCFRNWANHSLKVRHLQMQKQRVHTMILMWEFGDKKGSIRMCFLQWLKLYRHEKELGIFKAEHTKHRSEWDQYLDEECKKRDQQIQELMDKLQTKKARAHQDIHLVIEKWERGDLWGVAGQVVQSWYHYAHKLGSIKRKQQAVHQVLIQWECGHWEGMLVGAFVNWRNHANHEGSIRKQKQKWEDLLDGERSAKEDEARQKADEARRREELARNTVELVLRKWEMGSTVGALSEVFILWHKHAAKVAKVHRARESVHSTLLKWIEGDVLGNIHDCFLHWKHQASHRKKERLHANQLREQIERHTYKFLFSIDNLKNKHEIDMFLHALLWEWIRHTSHSKHYRVVEALERHQVERMSLEEELQRAYRQIDMITETLQKELKTKEELANELRQANETLRRKPHMESSSLLTIKDYRSTTSSVTSFDRDGGSTNDHDRDECTWDSAFNRMAHGNKS